MRERNTLACLGIGLAWELSGRRHFPVITPTLSFQRKTRKYNGYCRLYVTSVHEILSCKIGKETNCADLYVLTTHRIKNKLNVLNILFIYFKNGVLEHCHY